MNPAKTVALLSMCVILYFRCSPNTLHRAGLTEFWANPIYCEEHFSGASLSNQTLLMFPAVYGKGKDTTTLFSAQQQIEILQKVRSDLHFETSETFSQNYTDAHDTASLNRFYQALLSGKIVEAQTSDSIWKSMDASFMLFVRVKYAVRIKSFDGNWRKNVKMDVELWNVASQETVWRLDLTGLARTAELSDAQFMKSALIAAFCKVPGYVPENNESVW
jgi:hypothetical protein